MEETVEQVYQIPVSCQVCGRQDETVRFVVYPYVFSILVVTFQRVFSGCWCRLHRIQRWLVASLITSIFGWLGIPFGFVFTPLRLLQLARGGLQDRNINGRILYSIGEEKYQKGDIQGAIRCFEASLLYSDDAEINEKLRNLYRSQSRNSEDTSSGLVGLFAYFMIPIVVAGLGVFIGLIDFLVRWMSSSFWNSDIPIYLFILLQVPFIVFVYFCIVLVNYAFQVTVRFTRTYSVLFLSAMGVITSLLFINGIVAGGTYGIYLSYFINGFRELSEETGSTMVAVLTRGSSYIFSPASLSSNFTVNILFAILLLLSFTFSLLVLVPDLRKLSSQQMQIITLRSVGGQPESMFPFINWIGLMGVVFVFVILFAVTPQKSSIDALEAFDHTSQAIGYVNSGEFGKAIDEYSLAVQLKPNFPLGYLGLGYSYYYSGELTFAKDNFEKALRLSPEFLDAHFGLGSVFLQDGEYDLASKEFLEVLRFDPNNINGHLGLGWVYLNQFDIDNSKKEFENVLAVAPDSADAHFGLGSVYFIANDYDNAVDLWNETLKLNPSFSSAYFYNGLVYLRQGKYSDAEDAFQDALKIQPDYYDALNGLGEVRIAKYKYEDGLDYFNKAIALDSKKVDAISSKAFVLIQMSKYKEAISVMEPYIAQDEKVRLQLSYVYYQMNRKDEADKLLQDALSRADELDKVKQGYVFISIANVFSSTNRYQEARKYLELAMDSYPVGLDSWSRLRYAYILSSLKEFDKAEDAIHQASLIGHSELDIHLAKAGLLIDQEDLAGAENEIQAALRLDPNNSDAHAVLAFIYFEQNTITLSVLEAKAAIRLNPYSSHAYKQLAFAYQASGRKDEALAAAKEAVRLNRLDNMSHYILGVCYMDKGMRSQAINEFKIFLGNYWDRAYIRNYKVKAEEYLVNLKQTP